MYCMHVFQMSLTQLCSHECSCTSFFEIYKGKSPSFVKQETVMKKYLKPFSREVTQSLFRELASMKKVAEWIDIHTRFPLAYAHPIILASSEVWSALKGFHEKQAKQECWLLCVFLCVISPAVRRLCRGGSGFAWVIETD